MLRPNMWATKVLVLVALVFLTYPEVSMAQGQSLTLFSEVRGRLVNSEGKPQAGVRVSRYWQKTPEDEPVTSETTTDREGYFFFPAVTEQNRISRFLPGTPVIRQEITAFGATGSVTLWKTVKTNFDPNGELDGRPLILQCPIDIEPNGNGHFWGTCIEVATPFSNLAPLEMEELDLSWQWPAGRQVGVKLLVQLDLLEPTKRGLLGIGNSPSLAGSLPDPHELAGIVTHGPSEFQGNRVLLRIPGIETAGLTVGGIVALGLLGDGTTCVCIDPAPIVNDSERIEWLNNWSCE